MACKRVERNIIRCEKATSNNLHRPGFASANMAAMYAVYHGADGLINIAKRVSLLAHSLSKELKELGFNQVNKHFFLIQ